MKKLSLFIVFVVGSAFLHFPMWATPQDTKEDLLSDIEVLRQKVYNATAQNAKLEQEVERTKLLEQLRIEEEKAAALAAEKKRLEEDASLPKKWEDIPWDIMHTAWVNNYGTLESIYDPRKSGSEISKGLAKFKKKNLGEAHRSAVSQINSSHNNVLKSSPYQWAALGVNEGTEKHLQIGRTLLGMIWNQHFSGKIGFTI